MTELERDVEMLREACKALPEADKYVAALDRLVATLRHEREAKLQAIERWRSRAQLVALDGLVPESPARRTGRRTSPARRARSGSA